MARATTRHARKADAGSDWNRLGRDAARAGDYKQAREYFVKAVAADRRAVPARLNLAQVSLRLGDPALAAMTLTEAQYYSPGEVEIAYRLSRIAAVYELADVTGLNPDGLRAAMAFPDVDRQTIAQLAFRQIKQARQCQQVLTALWRDGNAGLRPFLEDRTAELFRNALLIAALSTGVNRDAELEILLTRLRAFILCDLRRQRLTDKALQALIVAKIRHNLANEFVMPVGAAEKSALGELVLDRKALLSGEREAAFAHLLAALYTPLPKLLGELDPANCSRIQPAGFRDLIVEVMRERTEEKSIVGTLDRLGSTDDPVSARVSAQYEANPYPRWTSIRIPQPGAIRPALARLVGEDRLKFMDDKFEVLIAGCGTGQQALQSAGGYGPKARITAFDLSRASLAYAKRKARLHAVNNVEFAVGDILALDTVEKTYDMIECIGVLHHMADPQDGWRHLLRRLRPGGLMYVGLYSAISREEIAALREEPGYPGPDCSEDEARAYRLQLMEREDDNEDNKFVRSRDFYSLSDFRDLVLHPQEAHFTIGAIEKFLKENELRFLGFTLDPGTEAVYQEMYPDDEMPGKLANWARFEEENPRTFDAMYRFWCEKG